MHSQLLAAATLPGAPRNVVATAGDGQASISWLAPTSNGGSVITGYKVYAYANGSSTAFASRSLAATTSFAFTGLANGTNYSFKVRARNSLGYGSYSALSNSVTPSAGGTPPGATLPGAPTLVTATAGDTEARLSWSPPTSNGGSAILGYEVSAYVNGSSTASLTRSNVTTTSNYAFTGLSNGTSYAFKVRARNAVGLGPYSALSNSVTPIAALPPIVADPAKDKVWITPNSLTPNVGPSGHREIRADYQEIWNKPGNWTEVASGTQVFGMFIESLYYMPSSDQDSLAQIIKQRRLKVAMESGALRPAFGEQCGTRSAAETLRSELGIFNNWKARAGGNTHLNYLTTDNSFYFSMSKAFADSQGLPRCTLSLSQLVDLYLNYYAEVSKAFPGIRIGFTEGLGEFRLRGLDGTQYVSTGPTNIEIDFETLVSLLTSRASARGLSISHFVLDFADAVESDARAYPGSPYIISGHDYGRMLAAEAIAKRYGLKVGLYVNWFNANSASEVREKSLAFRREYEKMGGRPDFSFFEFWQKDPLTLGSEHDGQSSTWNTIRDLIRDLIGSVFVSAKVSPVSITASSSLSSTPALVDDGNLSTGWNSGTSASVASPVWIQLDLGKTAAVNELRLTVMQYPSGATVHEIWAGPSPSTLTRIETISGATADGQVLVRTGTAYSGRSDIRYVKVVTTGSPSWVAWKEIEVRGR